jgi:hypothetical protein
MASNLSILDRKLLDAAANGATPNELEEQFFIPALDAVARVRGLLAQRDIWDEMEQRKLLIHSLMQRKSEIEKQIVEVENPKVLQAYANLVLAIDKIADKPMRISDAELEKVGQAQARALITMMEMAYHRAKQLLTTDFPFLDLSDVDQAFNDGLRDAAIAIEA